MRTFDEVKSKYRPRDKEELSLLLIDKSVKLWEIDTSLINNMEDLFVDSNRTSDEFEGIEFWNVSNVDKMNYMFSHCYNFNRNISSWNINDNCLVLGMFEGISLDENKKPPKLR